MRLGALASVRDRGLRNEGKCQVAKTRDSPRASASGSSFQPVGLTGWKPVPLENDRRGTSLSGERVVRHNYHYHHYRDTM